MELLDVNKEPCRLSFNSEVKNRIDDIPNYKVPKTPEEIKKEVDNYWEYIFEVLFR
jgi:elongation factor P hydroxylase